MQNSISTHTHVIEYVMYWKCDAFMKTVEINRMTVETKEIDESDSGDITFNFA